MWIDNLECFLKEKAIENRWKNIIMDTIGEFTMLLDWKVIVIELLKNSINGEVMHNIKLVKK